MNTQVIILQFSTVFLCIFSCMSAAVSRVSTAPTSIFDFTVTDAYHTQVSLEKFRGKVTLIVNIASESRITEMQYNGLMKLREKYYDDGFRILALPSRQFAQIPKEKAYETLFHLKQRNIEFDLFMAQGDVNGIYTVPLFKFLKWRSSSLYDTTVMGRFGKFLVDRSGEYVNSYVTRSDPLELSKDIERLLA